MWPFATAQRLLLLDLSYASGLQTWKPGCVAPPPLSQRLRLLFVFPPLGGSLRRNEMDPRLTLQPTNRHVEASRELCETFGLDRKE
jgi:hypothetical protein